MDRNIKRKSIALWMAIVLMSQVGGAINKKNTLKKDKAGVATTKAGNKVINKVISNAKSLGTPRKRGNSLNKFREKKSIEQKKDMLALTDVASSKGILPKGEEGGMSDATKLALGALGVVGLGYTAMGMFDALSEKSTPKNNPKGPGGDTPTVTPEDSKDADKAAAAAAAEAQRLKDAADNAPPVIPGKNGTADNAPPVIPWQWDVVIFSNATKADNGTRADNAIVPGGTIVNETIVIPGKNGTADNAPPVIPGKNGTADNETIVNGTGTTLNGIILGNLGRALYGNIFGAGFGVVGAGYGYKKFGGKRGALLSAGLGALGGNLLDGLVSEGSLQNSVVAQLASYGLTSAWNNPVPSFVALSFLVGLGKLYYSFKKNEETQKQKLLEEMKDWKGSNYGQSATQTLIDDQAAAQKLSNFIQLPREKLGYWIVPQEKLDEKDQKKLEDQVWEKLDDLEKARRTEEVADQMAKAQEQKEVADQMAKDQEQKELADQAAAQQKLANQKNLKALMDMEKIKKQQKTVQKINAREIIELVGLIEKYKAEMQKGDYDNASLKTMQDLKKSFETQLKYWAKFVIKLNLESPKDADEQNKFNNKFNKIFNNKFNKILDTIEQIEEILKNLNSKLDKQKENGGGALIQAKIDYKEATNKKLKSKSNAWIDAWNNAWKKRVAQEQKEKGSGGERQPIEEEKKNDKNFKKIPMMAGYLGEITEDLDEEIGDNDEREKARLALEEYEKTKLELEEAKDEEKLVMEEHEKAKLELEEAKDKAKLVMEEHEKEQLELAEADKQFGLTWEKHEEAKLALEEAKDKAKLALEAVRSIAPAEDKVVRFSVGDQ